MSETTSEETVPWYKGNHSQRTISEATLANAYRYLAQEHAAAALRGEFLLRRLSYYRTEECPKERRDLLEGGVKAHIEFERIDVPSHSQIEGAKRAGIGIHPGARNIVINNQVGLEFVADGFLLCLSECPNNDRLRGEGRNTVIEIIDLDKLAEAIVKCHQELLEGGRSGKVKYGPRIYEPMKDPSYLSPDPFLKGYDFETEREIRIVWEAKPNAPTQFITQCKEAANYVRTV